MHSETISTKRSADKCKTYYTIQADAWRGQTSAMDSKQHGKEIARLRNALGLTQDQLAKRSGLSPYAIRSIESGERDGKIPTLGKIAEGLGVSLASLFSGSEDGAAHGVGAVPVGGWVAANGDVVGEGVAAQIGGAFRAAPSAFSFERTIAAADPRPGSWGLEVKASMRRLSEGDTLIVSPSLQPQDTDLVVATQSTAAYHEAGGDDPQTKIREVVSRGDELWLWPLAADDQHASRLDDTWEIVGVVVEVRHHLRCHPDDFYVLCLTNTFRVPKVSLSGRCKEGANDLRRLEISGALGR